MKTETRLVNRYDFELYNQAIAQAKRQYHQDKDWAKFQTACTDAYTRMMQSPDTETIEVQTNR